MAHAEALLLRGAAALVTGAAGAAARHDATDVRLADGVVVELGRGLQPQPGERVLDATDCVVTPGWVNTHHHLFQSLLKGVPAAIDLTLMPWLQAVPYRHRGAFDEATLRLAARIGLVELLLSGCTTVADHHYLYHPGVGHDAAEILFDEAARLGLRFMLLRGGATQVRQVEADSPPHLRPETLDGMLADLERTVQRFHQPGARPMRRVAFAPTTINVSLRTDELKPAACAARALGVRLHSHLAETVSTIEQLREVHGMTPVQFAGEHEWLGPDVWFAHLVHVTPDEQRLLAATGTGIAHCPQSNARLGSGVAPAPVLARLGAPVSIGVDGAASNEAADMLSELHFAWLVHRAHAGSRSRARPEGDGEAGADAVTANDVMHWASAGGARVLGFDGVGTLAAGQAADLAVWSLDDARFFGLHDPGLAPVVSGARPTLKWLLCAGRVVAQDDRVPGLDLAQLRADARAAVRRLMEG
ncbi:amidohydrolase family protein [Calidifontimicrobium sp. SYSU G02091]|uniref:amidohydrolase family protein n=1 Tax=Calidifontimicrobium sp. SYSU G02091 TaxID=2926421 RepID=UPI001F536AFD|nr:amidohydrolase family protein [Calidifontimicrobium sp. SYSU G02091]MCI1192417.1 amidohydrolase family protein [Calidifontimicrobium sp. SYSU G02091]